MAWLRLLRIALLPTIVWDVVAGVWLSGAAIGTPAFVAVGVGLLVYHAGMILNDFADRRIDELHRPERPIPSGKVPAMAALVVGLAMLAAALGIAATQLGETAFELTVVLAGIVLVYDLGGPWVRRAVGPVMLAVARAGSLCLGAAATHESAEVLQAISAWTVAAYALFFLFLSRLATHEEDGAPGMRALPYLFIASLTPILFLSDPEHSPWIYPALAVLPWLLIRPAWPIRYERWEPFEVKIAVRRGLSAAPLVPAMGLLARARLAEAAVGVAVMLLVQTLARRMPPE